MNWDETETVLSKSQHHGSYYFILENLDSVGFEIFRVFQSNKKNLTEIKLLSNYGKKISIEDCGPELDNIEADDNQLNTIIKRYLTKYKFSSFSIEEELKISAEQLSTMWNNHRSWANLLDKTHDNEKPKDYVEKSIKERFEDDKNGKTAFIPIQYACKICKSYALSERKFGKNKDLLFGKKIDYYYYNENKKIVIQHSIIRSTFFNKKIKGEEVVIFYHSKRNYEKFVDNIYYLKNRNKKIKDDKLKKQQLKQNEIINNKKRLKNRFIKKEFEDL
jgi:hypothetical protein